jgi:hypothetical protein
MIFAYTKVRVLCLHAAFKFSNQLSGFIEDATFLGMNIRLSKIEVFLEHAVIVRKHLS